MKEEKRRRDLVAFGREVVRITFTVAFDETMSFHFAEVVAQLGQSIFVSLQAEGGQNGLVNLCGALA